VAVFSRRIVQTMLDENAQFLTKEQLGQQVARLNAHGFQPLDTEWEVAVLNAFSKLGKVDHEPSLEGTAKLDLLFTADDSSDFLADVASVSDEGFEERSPVKSFYVELQERLRRAGVLYKGWQLSIGSHPAKYGEPTIPAIPPRNEFSKEIFNGKFKQFLRTVKEQPHRSYTYSVRTSKTAISLTYDPSGKYFTTNGPVYSQARRKDQNPVFNALRLKAKQLKRVSYQGPKGIILCDGGTDMVHSRPRSSFDFNFNAVDATKDFLRQNKSVDFVLLISSVWIEEGLHRALVGGPVRKVKVTVVQNKHFERVPERIRELLGRLESCFPEPENTASGARETIRHGYNPTQLRPLAGGWGMSDTEVKLSASAVLGLLAGTVTQEELFRTLGFKPQSTKPSAIRNPFDYMLSRKMRLHEIVVEETTHDDGYLVFRFEGRDPALSSFVNPKA
jgi:hypothetical protein